MYAALPLKRHIKRHTAITPDQRLQGDARAGGGEEVGVAMMGTEILLEGPVSDDSGGEHSHLHPQQDTTELGMQSGARESRKPEEAPAEAHRQCC